VDGRQPGVAGGRAVAAHGLQVLQERGDQWGVELVQVEQPRLCSGGLLGECEQEPEGVAIGGDRVRAAVALVDQFSVKKR
jgi:hypothetical protein